MNLRMPQERLTQLIGSFAKTALESRQIARRLRELLPQRLVEIRTFKYGWRRLAAVERQTLVDPEYIALLDELVDINARARAARIQYETHTMLFEARRSLRIFQRRHTDKRS